MGSQSKIIVTCALALAWALPARSAEPIRMGAVLSVTGPAAFLGEPERNTVKMLEEEINKSGGLLGRKVEFIVYDDESDSTKAVMAFDRLIKKDRVVAVVGPTLTGSTLAMVPKAEDARVPLVSMAAAKKIVQPTKKWVFKSPQSDDLAVKAILKHAKKNGISKLALVTATDAYGAAGREELKELAPAAGMTVVADEVFAPKDTDMTVQLTKIRGTDAQAIICWGANPGPAVIVRNRAHLGIKLPLYMSHAVGSKKFIELAGPENAEGIMLPAGRLIVEDQVPANHPQKKVLSAYKRDYEKKFQQEVSTFGGHAWDAIMLVVNAVKVGNSAEPAAIRDSLEKITRFQGTAGEFNLSAQDHNGLGDGSFVMVKIIKGDWEAIQ
ncbi:MAG: ABC transporter substrate-binding protein [Deltaproteobacteria bacterium]|nr:ABC transporter substrate-binding protein [Deltaproteobacteria bacterium]